MAENLITRFGYRGKDLRGLKFGYLTVTDMAGYVANKKGHRLPSWLTVCVCGKTRVCDPQSLRVSGHQSCGCKWGSWKKTHGLTANTFRNSKHPVYEKWGSMMKRCYDPKCERYPSYGGRGITVCDRWHVAENFITDMLQAWKPRLTLERDDVNGNYCPENCRWATSDEQANNRTTCRMLTMNGKAQSVSMWAREFGVNPQRIIARLHLGWSDEDAITKPPRITSLTRTEAHSGIYLRSRCHAKQTEDPHADRAQYEHTIYSGVTQGLIKPNQLLFPF
jgi:hypothetical protein